MHLTRLKNLCRPNIFFIRVMPFGNFNYIRNCIVFALKPAFLNDICKMFIRTNKTKYFFSDCPWIDKVCAMQGTLDLYSYILLICRSRDNGLLILQWKRNNLIGF